MHFTFFNKVCLNTSLLFVFIILLFITSCVGKRQLVYMQKIKTNDTIAMANPLNMDSRIYPANNLSIYFYNSNPDINLLLNNGRSTTIALTTSQDPFLFSYIVNDSGQINLPVIGKIMVNGLTIEQAKLKITEEINKIFQDTYVTLTFTVKNITILGEVKTPNTYTIYKDNMSLIQLIGIAGDITEYGNRKNIKIIRQTHRGALVSYIDVTSSSFITSEFYYLQNNDIIYIEPLVAKTYQTRSFPIVTIISIITSVFVLYTTYVK